MLEKHIYKLIDTMRGKPSSPAFQDRYNTAVMLLKGEHPLVRTLASPVYVTDLGVRRFTDSKVFYEEHIRISGLDAISQTGLETLLMKAPLSSLADILDAVILSCGSYDSCSRAIINRRGELLADGKYQILVAAGTILAANNNYYALELFDYASEKATSQNDAYESQHRAAAYLIKRKKEIKIGTERLTAAREKYIDCSTSNGLADEALFHNLIALTRVEENINEAMSHLNIARECLLESLTQEKASCELLSRVGRYLGQVSINQAQIAVMKGNLTHSARILEENLESVRTSAFEYLPEALAELAFVYFLEKRYADSYSLANEAFWRLNIIGSLKAMRQTKEIMAACLWNMGDYTFAEKIATLAETDLLGIEGLHDVRCR